MLLGYLLGLEEGKLSEKERLANERRKIEEEQLNALKEQYMLGLLMPVRGQTDFKVVVREPNLFEFSMVGSYLSVLNHLSSILNTIRLVILEFLRGILLKLESMSPIRRLSYCRIQLHLFRL